MIEVQSQFFHIVLPYGSPNGGFFGISLDRHTPLMGHSPKLKREPKREGGESEESPEIPQRRKRTDKKRLWWVSSLIWSIDRN